MTPMPTKRPKSNKIRSSTGAAPEVTVIEFAASETRRNVLVVIGVLLVIAIAVATYVGMKRSLIAVRGVSMQTLLDAEVRALDVWIRQKSLLAERWAADEGVREAVGVIVGAYRSIEVSKARSGRYAGRPRWDG